MIEAIDGKDGSRYLKIPHYADPERDAEWLAKVEHEMKATPRDFRREILMDDTVHDGDPVFPQYVDRIHASNLDPKLLSDCEGQLYGGWDCGTSRMPAFCLARLTKNSKQLRFLMEVVPDRPMSMEIFAPIVRTQLKMFLPGEWGNVLHVGDATVTTKSGAVERSAGDVARDYGFHIKPGVQSIDRREKAVGSLLTDWCDETGGKPRVLYSVVGCPILVAGMRGAYCIRPKPSGDESGPGMQAQEPTKNFYSHVNDGHQYLCVDVEKLVKIGVRSQRRSRW